MMHPSSPSRRVALLAAALAVAWLPGCSSGGSGLTTSSLFGGSAQPAPAATTDPAAAPAAVAAPAPPPATPVQRAFHVGSVSARARHCGYNFDPAKLKANYLAAEQTMGVGADQFPNLEKTYQVAFNGVTKAATEDPAYCSDKKTQTIKADLAKLLAGDFNPPPAKQQVAKAADEGFFGGFFSGSSEESGPSYGSGDWWDKQREKAGR